MSVITFTQALMDSVETVRWEQSRRDIAFESPFGSQGMEVSSPLWSAQIKCGPMLESLSGAWKVLLMQLRGRTNQLALWDPARPEPVGTMRGSMTLNASVVAGASSMAVVAAGEAGETLVQGDLLGLGSGLTQQVVMVTADAVANGSGVISITFEPPLRNAFAGGAAVTWDRPQALFRNASAKPGWDYAAQMASGFELDLIEDTRP